MISEKEVTGNTYQIDHIKRKLCEEMWIQEHLQEKEVTVSYERKSSQCSRNFSEYRFDFPEHIQSDEAVNNLVQIFCRISILFI